MSSTSVRQQVLLPILPLLFAPLAAGQTLVKDINPSVPTGVEGSEPAAFAFAGGLTFFVAEGDGTGRELFVSDGTELGTGLLVDLQPGIVSSSPDDLSALGSEVFLLATGPSGRTIYRSDGTPGGTTEFTSVQPFAGPLSLATHGGLMYFVAQDGTGLVPGSHLWVSDGTSAGTSILLQSSGNVPLLNEGTGPFFYFRMGLTEQWRTDGTAAGTIMLAGGFTLLKDASAANGTFWFIDKIENEPFLPLKFLWKSDGTVAGTTLVKDLGSMQANRLTAVDNGAYFRATTFSANHEPYFTDGTDAGTIQLEVNPGSTASSPNDFTPAGGNSVYFAATVAGLGRELWKSDGTVAGTVLVADIAPGAQSSNPAELAMLNGEIFFQAEDSVATGVELWKSDGSAVGTSKVDEINFASDADPANLAAGNGLVWFSAIGDAVGEELWTSDGSSAELVADLLQNTATSDTGLQFLADLNGKLLFLADDGNSGWEPWVSDGTEEGTFQLADVNPGLSGIVVGTGAADYALFQEWLYFIARIGHQWELWRTDGTVEGTLSVLPGVHTTQLLATPGKLYLRANDGINGDEPWVLEDKFGVPHLVADIAAGGNSSPHGFIALGDRAVFSAYTPTRGFEPWVSDGTAAGTLALADIQPGPDSSGPVEFVHYQGRVFFVATRGDFGGSAYLWSTDGTKAGTVEELDIAAVTADDDARDLTVAGGLLYFVSDAVDDELYVTDGTPAGTLALGVDDIDEFDALFAVGDNLIATRSNIDVVVGTDGTPAGTHELLPYVGLNTQYYVEVAGDLAYVQKANELYVTDGTPAGTNLVTELLPFPVSELQNKDLGARAVSSDNRVLVAGYDVVNGLEVWVSDGTTAGTHVLVDVDLGLGGSEPAGFLRAGDSVYFAADDGVAGRELHALPFATTGGYVVEPFGTSCPMTTGEIPRMSSSGDPNVGSTNFTVDYVDAAPFAPALLFYSLDRGVGTLGGGCALYFGVPFYVHPELALADGAGVGSLPIPVPNKPALAGLPLYFQYTVADPGGVIFGTLAPTDGLEVLLAP